MAQSREWWIEFDRRFDPFRSPGGIDAIYAPRADAPSDLLLDDLRFAAEPRAYRALLCGARGSGKTTELHRLFQDLEREGELLPVYVDIAAVLLDDAPTAAWLPLVAATVRAASVEWNAPPVESADDRLLPALDRIGVGASAFAHILQFIGPLAAIAGPSGTALSAFTAGAVPAAKALSELGRVARSELEKTRRAAVEDVEAVADAIRAELERLEAATSGRPAVLLLDGLDKRRSVDGVVEALDDAELLFTFPAALVLSGPVQMRYDPRFAALTLPGAFRSEVLYNVPVVDRDGSPKSLGIDVMREIVTRRVAGEVDGAGFADVFTDADVERAARCSSGLPREFIELLRLAGKEARRAGRDAVGPDDLDRAVRRRRHSYQAGLREDTWNVLQRVLETGEPPTADLDELLFHNQVACYPNDDLWFRPNELLVPYIRERAGRSR